MAKKAIQPSFIRTFVPVGTAAQPLAGDDSFSIFSYNILSDGSAKPNFFPKVADKTALLWTNRSRTILSQVKALKPSIICLQEVDHYKDFFVPGLPEYDSGFKSRTGKTDGSCTFFLRSEFSLYEKIDVEYDDLAGGYPSSSSTPDAQESNDPATLRTGSVALVFVLQRVSDEKLIVVANTHLFWHPDATPTREAQANYLLEKLSSICETYGDEISGVFICGDFNDRSDSKCVQLLLGNSNTNMLRFDHAYSSYASAGVTETRTNAKNSRTPAAASEAAPLTMYTPQYKGFIDFIFYSSLGKWRPSSVLTLPAEHQLKEICGASLPSADFPSDHISIMARFESV